jgi:hypothetical protein
MLQRRNPWSQTIRQQMNWRNKFAWRDKMSWRTGLAIAAAAFVLFYPIYCVLETAISHGIHPRGDILVVDMKAMSDFNLDQTQGQTSDIPVYYRRLDGKRIELAGEMWSPDSAASSVGKFQLVYSIASCCFSGPPKVQHFVKATVEPGHAVDFRQGIVNVVGTLHVGVERADGQVQSVYRMDVEKVE